MICIQTYKEAADARSNNNNSYNNNNIQVNDNDNKQIQIQRQRERERKSQHFLLNILRPTFGFGIDQVTNIEKLTRQLGPNVESGRRNGHKSERARERGAIGGRHLQSAPQ